MYVPKMRSAGKFTVLWNRACTVNKDFYLTKTQKCKNTNKTNCCKSRQGL